MHIENKVTEFARTATAQMSTAEFWVSGAEGHRASTVPKMTPFHPDDGEIVMIRSIRVGAFAAPLYVFYMVFQQGLK